MLPNRTSPPGGNHQVPPAGVTSNVSVRSRRWQPPPRSPARGTIGYVGVPQGVETTGFLGTMFGKNVSLNGGIAPVRSYAEELMADVLRGTLDPSPVFTKTVGLGGVPEGYRAMDERDAVKVMVRIDG